MTNQQSLFDFAGLCVMSVPEGTPGPWLLFRLFYLGCLRPHLLMPPPPALLLSAHRVPSAADVLAALRPSSQLILTPKPTR